MIFFYFRSKYKIFFLAGGGFGGDGVGGGGFRW